MARNKKNDPEVLAAQAAAERQQAFDLAWQTFWASPIGQARLAYRRGDKVFQYSLDVLDQKAMANYFFGGASSQKSHAADPSAVLNGVCNEGWDVIAADFPFVIEGQKTRRATMVGAKGENIAVDGTVIGYYVLRRLEANCVEETDDELKSRLAS